jgi:hypothetical protein
MSDLEKLTEESANSGGVCSTFINNELSCNKYVGVWFKIKTFQHIRPWKQQSPQLDKEKKIPISPVAKIVK